MPKKPLPQFNSIEEAREFYKKYGKLTPKGVDGHRGERHLYHYEVKDGREMSLYLYKDGRVEEITFDKKAMPTFISHEEAEKKIETNREVLTEFYSKGICECKAEGRFRWKVIGGARVYMCVKCEKPVYYKM